MLEPAPHSEEPSAPGGGEPPSMAGYLTLELDVRELQAYSTPAGTSPDPGERHGYGGQDLAEETFGWPDGTPEDMHLEAAELSGSERMDFPGYLTIEIEELPRDGLTS